MNRLQTHRHSFFMRLQSFGLRHFLNHRTEIFQPFGRNLLESNFTSEAIEIYPAIRLGIPTGRKRVIRPRSIIAGTFGGIIS